MKKEYLLIVCLWFLLIQTLPAQTNSGVISGIIKNAQGHSLSGVNIRLVAMKDSSLIGSMISNDEGKFSTKKLSFGKYMLKCSMVGYKNFNTTSFVVDANNPSITLPVIVLTTANNTSLKEVVITTQKPLIEHKIDRTIVNVDAMTTAAGSNMLEVISQSPGVSVGVNGDISLQGKSGVVVLVDDKPTYLSSQDLAAYLRSLPAGVADRIELISNPPAKYDAAGSAIINIVLKKRKTLGFNGNINLGYTQGVYARSNDALNLNFRDKKVNIFSNISYSLDQNFTNETSQRYYYNTEDSPLSTIQIKNNYHYLSNGYNMRTGVDYFASGKTTLGIMVTGDARPKTDHQSNSFRQFSEHMVLDSIGEGTTHGKFGWKNAGINFNLQHKPDTVGTILSSDLDYITYRSSGNQISSNQIYQVDHQLNNFYTLKYDLPSEITIYSAKMDYSHPFGNKFRFETGLKTSLVITDNSTNKFDLQETGFLLDYKSSNHFVYRENINAAYVSMRKEWDRWGVQIGFRIENTQAQGHLLGNEAVHDSSFHKSYTHLFPTIYVSYKLDDKGDHTIVIDYSTRIRRPSYHQLNPFIIFRDKFSYSASNPNLNPHFNQYIGLNYSYKQYVGISLAYMHINHIIQPLTRSSGDSLISRPENFGLNYSYNLIPYIALNPWKWWRLQTNGIIFYLVNKGNAFGQKIYSELFTCELGLNNQFRFGQGWNCDLNGFYASRHNGGQSFIEPLWRIDFGIQKNIMNDKGIIRLKINDVFYSFNRRDKIIGLYQASASRVITSDTRGVGISFNYRFGNQFNNKKRDNSGSAEDEKGRAN